MKKKRKPNSGSFKPGNQVRLLHGVNSKSKVLKFDDKRTKQGRQLAAIIEELEADLGEISPGQSLLIANIRSKLQTLMMINDYVNRLKTDMVDEKGELPPCLGKNYLAFSNSLRLDIQVLYQLAGRQPKKDLTLSGYLQKKNYGKAKTITKATN